MNKRDLLLKYDLMTKMGNVSSRYRQIFRLLSPEYTCPPTIPSAKVLTMGEREADHMVVPVLWAIIMCSWGLRELSTKGVLMEFPRIVGCRRVSNLVTEACFTRSEQRTGLYLYPLSMDSQWLVLAARIQYATAVIFRWQVRSSSFVGSCYFKGIVVKGIEFTDKYSSLMRH